MSGTSPVTRDTSPVARSYACDVRRETPPTAEVPKLRAVPSQITALPMTTAPSPVKVARYERPVAAITPV